MKRTKSRSSAAPRRTSSRRPRSAHPDRARSRNDASSTQTSGVSTGTQDIGNSGLLQALKAAKKIAGVASKSAAEASDAGVENAGSTIQELVAKASALAQGSGAAIAEGLLSTAQTASEQSTTPAHDVPDLDTHEQWGPYPVRTAEPFQQDLEAELANSPHAREALEGLTADPGFATLDLFERSGLLSRFSDAPNAATAQYLRGVAAYHTAEDKEEGFETYTDLLNPDSGSFSVNGTTYSIVNGQLQDAEGQSVGNIRTDGTYQMNEDEERSSIYDDIHARVHMVEGEGEQAVTLLNLHDSDPRGKLTGDGMNDTFAGLATQTIRDLRRENLGMFVTDGYRSLAEQDRLYNQGRTTPGNIVTGARGGRSWHNYGLGVDMALQDERGQPHWSTRGDNEDHFTRYGELAAQNGLSWGGDWTRLVDLPHVEFHPGYSDGEAGKLESTLRNQGLEAAWDIMGIGEQD